MLRYQSPYAELGTLEGLDSVATELAQGNVSQQPQQTCRSFITHPILIPPPSQCHGERSFVKSIHQLCEGSYVSECSRCKNLSRCHAQIRRLVVGFLPVGLVSEFQNRSIAAATQHDVILTKHHNCRSTLLVVPSLSLVDVLQRVGTSPDDALL